MIGISMYLLIESARSEPDLGHRWDPGVKLIV